MLRGTAPGGGNVTGVSFYTAPLVTKRLDLARELVPDGSLIALLGLVQVLTGQAWVDRLSIPGLTATEATGLASRG